MNGPAFVVISMMCVAAALGRAGEAAAQPAAPPPLAASAAAPPARAEAARALEKCEASVEETLRKLRGAAAHEVQFSTQRQVAPADEGDIGIKGAGRYFGRDGARAGGERASASRGGNSFTYSCTFNTRSGLASGVVLREAGASAAPPVQNWQPDLSRFSPEACESAVAQLVKARHPRVAHIGLEPDTRRLEPGPDNRLLLLGHGAVQRAPGMHAVPFSFSCEIDPRSGRVVAVKASV